MKASQRWIVVEGHVYRLRDTFDESKEAIESADVLQKQKPVVITATKTGKWAVYSRSKKNE